MWIKVFDRAGRVALARCLEIVKEVGKSFNTFVPGRQMQTLVRRMDVVIGQAKAGEE